MTDGKPRIDALVIEIRRLGGIARRKAVFDRGHAWRTQQAAIDSARLIAIGRLWLALPDADAELKAAAEQGVVLTCVSAAARLGCWTLQSPYPHMAALSRNRRGHLPATTTLHWAKPVVPRHPDALVDPVENVLTLVAACQPHEHALIVWDSALRKGLVDPLALARLPLTRTARGLLEEASAIADSGLETIFFTRLRWLGERIVPQAWIFGHRVDFLIGERLAVQIDGGHHVDGQRTSDIRHDAELMLRGYHVIRVGYTQIMHDWPGVQLLITRAVAQGLHRAG